MALVACNNEKTGSNLPQVSQTDSLQKIIEQKDNEINDMMGILNDIDEGFRLINEAENRVSVAKDGEGADKKQRIRENIQFIQQRLAQNRELIEKLRKQVSESSVKGEEMKRTIENLVKQLEDKEPPAERSPCTARGKGHTYRGARHDNQLAQQGCKQPEG